MVKKKEFGEIVPKITRKGRATTSTRGDGAEALEKGSQNRLDSNSLVHQIRKQKRVVQSDGADRHKTFARQKALPRGRET